MIRLGAINWGSAINQNCGLNAGLVAWWLARPGINGGTLYDLAGLRHGTLTNSPTWGASSRSGSPGALAFASASSQRVTLPVTGLVANVAAVTLSAWVNTSDASASMYVIDVESNTGSTRAALRFVSGAMQVLGRAGDAETTQNAVTSATYNNGAWRHVVGVIDYANDTIVIYVDGLVAASTGTITFTATATTNSDPTSAVIGARAAAGFFNGSIDDVRIHYRVLSPSEVFQLYRDSLSGYPLTLNRLEHKFGKAAAAGPSGPPFHPVGPGGGFVGAGGFVGSRT